MFFSSDSATAGGIQEHVYYLAVNLEKLGHQVTVFGPKKTNDSAISKLSWSRKIFRIQTADWRRPELHHER